MMLDESQVKALYLAALRLESEEEREAFLEEQCGEDRRARAKIRRLLREYQSFPLPATRDDTFDSQEFTTDEILEDADGRYRLGKEIARGGMGSIVKAWDTVLNRRLVVKVLLKKDKKRSVRRFIREARITGQLQHPGIPPVYEIGHLDDGRPFFSMKLVKGETLNALLGAREDPDEERGKFLGIFEQVCQTVAYAHSRQVIHRDLKPSNVMVGAFGEVQVMDWGMAKVLSRSDVKDDDPGNHSEAPIEHTQILAAPTDAEDEEYPEETQMGHVMGTPSYMPAEQAQGEIDLLDQRADVFGLGAILCKILTGKPPYWGKNVIHSARRAMLDPCFQLLNTCGADIELIALAKHCLQPYPSNRPLDAGEVADRVSAYISSVESKLREAELEHARATEVEKRRQANETLAIARAEAERKKRRVTFALVTSVLLLIGVAGGLFSSLSARKKAEESESRALSARKTALDAARQASQERSRAEQASVAEQLQRQRAEREATNAVATVKKLEVALAQARAAKRAAEAATRQARKSRTDAEEATKRAKAAESQAVADRTSAEDAERRAIADRRRAEREKSLADQSAALADQRQRLLQKLLPLLDDYTDDIVKSAEALRKQGKARQALELLLGFCDLVMGEETGTFAAPLLDYYTYELQAGRRAAKTDLAIPPRTLFENLMLPAIKLADAELERRFVSELKTLTARLYVFRARLLLQAPNGEWPEGIEPRKLAFESFDRAAQLKPKNRQYLIGRAAARFQLPQRDFLKIAQDLKAALARSSPSDDPAQIARLSTNERQRVAEIRHALGNVAEFFALQGREQETQYLEVAEKHHRLAFALDSRQRYRIGQARTLRKLAVADREATKPETRSQAEKLLEQAIQHDPADAEAWSEMGHLRLAQNRPEDARKAFGSAIKYARQQNRNQRVFDYLCGQARAFNKVGESRYALMAVEKAMDLGREMTANAHYERGFAFWKMGKTENALKALDEALKLAPDHVESLMTRSRIVFGMKAPESPTKAQTTQAFAGVAELLERDDLSVAERAEASFIISSGWFRYHINHKSEVLVEANRRKAERALISCLKFALNAARDSEAYRDSARMFFDYARRTTLNSKGLQKTSLDLQSGFKQLSGK